MPLPANDPHLTYLDFAGHVGDYLGYGWGEHNGQRAYTADRLLHVNKSCIAPGLGMFYRAVSLKPEFNGHQWSFLHPTSKLTLLDGETELVLPPGCGPSIEGPIVYSSDNGLTWGPLRTTVWGEIRNAFAEFPSRTGVPEMVAVEPLADAGSHQQRHKLVFYPTADRDITIRLSYRIAGEVLTEVRPYHFGGAAHSDTVLAAVLAAAEQFRDNVRPGEGPKWLYYEACLEASVRLDRRATPATLGYNGDGDGSVWPGPEGWRRYNGSLVTINGLTPE